ncbi:30S ribosomal protein S8 [Candidatus Woesebacteria bacterium RIFOXYB1_FULL_38_16]|uniref:Small ribosomal subunit protein uS8 n=1 Tax=Candidatus Woesebacteria bacterium RIFOXYB1_FULL_38_16 TaxID=1802538 RepID=A0A1F8CUV6_9BACT|nr:MAG: 30S ribosomal protein S8 [Candidatus Woesebacteria bacterium RIFOXYA1_FULL_38_9]OGM80052.1 MAG: 30S ribosomal protein S8 [Candidatus Woesebacteria bacterium RIFOXYB1_FULL_38_16]
MVNYPIGDFIIRIKNAARSGQKEVVVKKTKFINEMAKVLKKEGFLNKISENNGDLTVELATHKKEVVIVDMKLISKPGLRIYADTDELSKRRGVSVLILSTPKGLMSQKEALKNGVGGEVIVEVI